VSGLAVVLCVKSNGTSSFVFDAADRLLASGSGVGVVYDAWGRTTTLPAGLTSTPVAGDASSTYYVNDLVRSLAQGGGTRTWVLDPANRLASMSTTGLGSTGLVNHYSDVSSDSPAWTSDTSLSGVVTTRRYVPGFTGLLAEVAVTGVVSSTVVELTGLHGDVLRTTTPSATLAPDGVGVWADEFGRVLDATGSLTTGPRYGWLGGKQRATDTGATGVTLMGVRLYSPIIGRFLSTDPVYGGNDNTYTYPVDPVNSFDLDGRMLKRPDGTGSCNAKCQKFLAKLARKAVAAEKEGDLHKFARLLFTISFFLGSIPGVLCEACSTAAAAFGAFSAFFFLVTGDRSNSVKALIGAGLGLLGARGLQKYVGDAMKQITNPNTSVGRLLAGYLGDSFMTTLIVGVSETAWPG
jgi:RHS repeat-associated protein